MKSQVAVRAYRERNGLLNGMIVVRKEEAFGLWSHTKGSFYHDGRYANLPEVVTHYNTSLPGGPLGLSVAASNDLV